MQDCYCCCCNNKKKNLVLLGLSGSDQLAQEIAGFLKIKVSELALKRFADGEIFVKVKSSVRGKNVFLIKSTSPPVNDNLLELLITIDALKRASAKTINLVVPYYGYARQDRKESGREAITSKLVADLLTKSGADRLLTFELHSPQIQGFFDIPVDDLRATYGFIDTLIKEQKNDSYRDVVFVSPDLGGIRRARRYAKFLGAKIAVIDKIRKKINESKTTFILGEVKNKICYLVDDILDTGGTIINAIKLLRKKKNKAKKIFVIITHALFSGNSLAKFKELLEKGEIEKLFITNTIPLAAKFETFNDKYLKIVSVGKFIADIIKAIINDFSLTEVYNKKVSGVIQKLFELKKNKDFLKK